MRIGNRIPSMKASGKAGREIAHRTRALLAAVDRSLLPPRDDAKSTI
ncbi:hypothetical protein [Frigidibacter sp. MR17.24]